MEPLGPAFAAAFWAGILTSISPCPLATNIAAVSFLAKHVGSPRKIYVGGLLYTLGRALSYAVLAAILIGSLLAAPGVSHFLQKYMNRALGPFMVLTGLILLNAIPLKFAGFGSKSFQERLEPWGLWAALPLGALFALSLCPTSAALFFATLLPIALNLQSPVVVPFVYAVGTALPVILFALLIGVGTRWVAVAYNRLSVIEPWARIATAVVFILVGIHLTLEYVFAVDLAEMLLG